MATDTAKRLYGPVLLGTTAVNIYMAPALTKAILRSIHVCNSSTTLVKSFTMSIGADATGTRIFALVSIQPQGTFDWSGFIVLEPGEALQAYASAATDVSLTISGVEVS